MPNVLSEARRRKTTQTSECLHELFFTSLLVNGMADKRAFHYSTKLNLVQNNFINSTLILMTTLVNQDGFMGLGTLFCVTLERLKHLQHWIYIALFHVCAVEHCILNIHLT